MQRSAMGRLRFCIVRCDPWLERNKVFHVREAALDRGELHLYLTDGTIAFTHDVLGRVTGAYFEGEGEVLMRPPDLTEHASLGLFSGLGVLDEHFTAAYLRFNRDLESELKPYLRDSEEPEDFVRAHDGWPGSSPNWMGCDCLRALRKMRRSRRMTIFCTRGWPRGWEPRYL